MSIIGNPTVEIMEGFLGEIRIFAGNSAPDNWSFCEGQLLTIAENSSLYSLLGTAFGGDGRVTFALPDTRGRVMVGMGNGPELSDRNLGNVGGQETVALTVAEMPNHNHSATIHRGYMGNDGTYNPPAYNGDVGDTNSPVDAIFALEDNGVQVYNSSSEQMLGYTASWNVDIDPELNVSNTGNSIGHPNMMPALALNYIICTKGGQYPQKQRG